MYCGQCGQEGIPKQRFCMVCGTSLSFYKSALVPKPSNLVPPNDQQINVVPEVIDIPQSSTAHVVEDLKPQGKEVKGWLYFFCIAHTILGPLRNLSVLIDLKDPLDKAIIIAFIVAQIWVGVSVWRLAPSTFKNLKMYYVFVFILCCVYLLVGDYPEAAKLALTTVIWLGYFQFSKRVKHTFGRNLFERK